MIIPEQLHAALEDVCAYLESGSSFDQAVNIVSVDTGIPADVLKLRFERAYGPSSEYLRKIELRSNGERVANLTREFTKAIANRFLSKCDIDYQAAKSDHAFHAEHAAIESSLGKLDARLESRGLPRSWRLHVQDQFRLRAWKAAAAEAKSGAIRSHWFA